MKTAFQIVQIGIGCLLSFLAMVVIPVTSVPVVMVVLSGVGAAYAIMFCYL